MYREFEKKKGGMRHLIEKSYYISMPGYVILYVGVTLYYLSYRFKWHGPVKCQNLKVS